MKTAVPVTFCLIALAVIGAWLALDENRATSPTGSEHAESPPTLVFYTNPGATTPQLPFWAANDKEFPP